MLTCTEFKILNSILFLKTGFQVGCCDSLGVSRVIYRGDNNFDQACSGKAGAHSELTHTLLGELTVGLHKLSEANPGVIRKS